MSCSFSVFLQHFMLCKAHCIVIVYMYVFLPIVEFPVSRDWGFLCVIVLTCPQYVQHNACMLVGVQDMFASWLNGNLNLKLYQVGGAIQMKRIMLHEVLRLLQLVNCCPCILFCIIYIGSMKNELWRLFSHFWWVVLTTVLLTEPVKIGM